MKNFFTGIGCMILISLVSCKKSSQEPDSNGSYLSVIKSTNTCSNCTPSGGIETFTYNMNHQVTSIISSYDGEIFTTTFSYNAQSQLVSVSESNSVAGPVDTYSFVYDGHGRIVKTTGTAMLSNLGINDKTFTYDAANRVVADTTHNLQTATVTNYQVYEYDNNGNISKVTLFNTSGGTPQVSSVQNITYNDKLNPYYPLRESYFFFSDQWPFLSKNMTVDALTAPSSSYTYFSNGLPRQLVYKDRGNGSQSVIDYTYVP